MSDAQVHQGNYSTTPSAAPELPAYLLASFVSVVEQQSITHAAAIMSVPYTLVAKQMARLEGLVGVPLITQDRGKIRLTDEGVGLYDEVSALTANLQRQALHSVQQAKAAPAARTGRPTLNIEFSVWGIAAALRPYLTKLRSLPCGFNFVSPGALSEPADVICYLGKRPKDGYRTAVLFGEEVVAVCAPDYPIPQGGLDANSFGGEPLLSLGHPDHAQDWSAFLGRDPELPLPGVAKEPYTSFGGYLRALQAGRGIGVGMAPLFDAHLTAGTLQLASKRRLWRNRACYLGVREDAPNTELARAFSGIVETVFAAQSDVEQAS